MKYAFLGPESTGKSTIAKELSNRLNGVYVKEIARNYLKDIGLDYGYEDIIEIAKQQYALELNLTDTNPEKSIFCDTELITIEVWLEYKGWEVPSWIPDAIHRSYYDMYFLMNIDLPWEQDDLRANESDREDIFKLFKRKLNFYNKKWELISGMKEERVDNTLSHLRSLLPSCTEKSKK